MEYALVTGGSRGIGRAIAVLLARNGFKVIVNYHANDREAQKTLSLITQDGGVAELLKFNVADNNACMAAIDNWQQLHPDDYISVLVNNAGIRSDELMALMDVSDFERVIQNNLLSFFYLTRLLIPQMVRHRNGRIVNIASLSGLKGVAGQTNYAASKGGLIAATKSLAQELAKKKITVNAVAPGFIRTDMVEGLDEMSLKQMIPMARFGEPEEVASLVNFLVSKEASYITGECININGGLYS